MLAQSFEFRVQLGELIVGRSSRVSLPPERIEFGCQLAELPLQLALGTAGSGFRLAGVSGFGFRPSQSLLEVAHLILQIAVTALCLSLQLKRLLQFVFFLLEPLCLSLHFPLEGPDPFALLWGLAIGAPQLLDFLGQRPQFFEESVGQIDAFVHAPGSGRCER